jgi:hypothetical protein
VVLLLTSAALASPWVREPGAWYLKGTASTFASPRQALEYRAHTLGLYGEVGVTRGVQVVGSLPFSWVHNRFSGSSLRYRDAGWGQGQLGLGVRPPRVELPMSLHVVSRLPLYGPPAALDPAMGNGQVDVDTIGAIGASPRVGATRLWTSAELGVRVRTGWVPREDPAPADPRDGGLYRLQLGILPEAGSRDLGWASLEAAGEVGARATQQVACSVATRVGAGLNIELGASWLWAAREDTTGWGASFGLSHIRGR